MSHQFAQISDPHLSTLENVDPRDLINKRALGYLSWRRKRRFEHRREVLAALQQDLALDELSQLLVTGDLTHIGLPSEFRQASDWLHQLGPAEKLALVPGNHDSCVSEDWDQTYALWREYMDSDQPAKDSEDLFPSLRVRGDLAFIGLSTACPKPPLMATGTADAAQLQRLPALLRETGKRGLFRVVYLHHCPLPGVEKWRKRLTNAQDVSDILARGRGGAGTARPWTPGAPAPDCSSRGTAKRRCWRFPPPLHWACTALISPLQSLHGHAAGRGLAAGHRPQGLRRWGWELHRRRAKRGMNIMRPGRQPSPGTP